MMRRKNAISFGAIAAVFMVLLLSSSIAPMTGSVQLTDQPKPTIGGEQPLQEIPVAFTSGVTTSFTSTETMTISTGNKIKVWSDVEMNFTSTVKMTFIEAVPDGILQPCDWIIVQDPAGYLPGMCTWWELLDSMGLPTGYEFHIDMGSETAQFHVDMISPGSITIPTPPYYAQLKINVVGPCEYYEVNSPADWYPAPCSWWEILDPETGQLTGYEFHVDWTNESCEFHIDQIIPGPYWLPYPMYWYYTIKARMKIQSVDACTILNLDEQSAMIPTRCSWWEILDPTSGERTGSEFHVDDVWPDDSIYQLHVDGVLPGPFVFPSPGVLSFEAEQKIVNVTSCDWFTIEEPVEYFSEICSWWEILDPSGAPTGIEFHIDNAYPGGFHVDQVTPTDPAQIPWSPPTVTISVTKKMTNITQCGWFKVTDLTTIPEPCTWWTVNNPMGGTIEFHVDIANPDGTFHVDIASEPIEPLPPSYALTAKRLISSIQPCDWFTLALGSHVMPACTWYRVTNPLGSYLEFHVDATNGYDRFHVDQASGILTRPTLTVWAVNFVPTAPTWFKKPPYPDYAPNGMPDFDQKQDQWGTGGVFTWCGPVSVANSLWWLDSEYESLYNPLPVPPPAISDNFPLVTSYNPQIWDDHDPQNVAPLVQNLAFLMDADGIRTGLPHQGVSYTDMETGISQYLQQQGVNPKGDVDGDGSVTYGDLEIFIGAMGSVPGDPNWNMQADVAQPLNIIDAADYEMVNTNLGLTGMFYEHTAGFSIEWVENEIYRCQDVVLFLEFLVEDSPGIWRPFYEMSSFEAGHFVTCAGVNSTNYQLLVSDPWWDASEAGFLGEVPVAHPPMHPTTLHNDTLFVSYDAYGVLYWPTGQSPYGAGAWELTNYLQQLGYGPSYHAFIRVAVVTSPLEVAQNHDIAVIDIATSKTGCTPKETLGEGKPIDINVTVINQGETSETFTVRTWANDTMISEYVVVDLAPGATLLWSEDDEIIGGGKGSIRIMANCTIVTGETDTADNTLVYGYIFQTLAGDIDGDRDVDIFDIVRMAGVYGVSFPNPRYDPNSDIDNNKILNIFDIVAAAGNYGKHW